MSAISNVTTPSSAQIEAKIRAARDHMANLEDEARDLSLPAVSGDGEAAVSLAALQAQINLVNSDILVLENAKVAAIGKEIAAERARDSAYRARHLSIAKEQAAHLVELAGRIDHIEAEIKALIVDINATEASIWSALREAAVESPGAVPGRKGLSNTVMSHIELVVSGRAMFLSNQRSIVDTARIAWAHLLEPGDDI